MFIGCTARFERPCFMRPVCTYEGLIKGVTVGRYCITFDVDVYRRCDFAVDEQKKFDISQFVAMLVKE